jgi:hypothetical protein
MKTRQAFAFVPRSARVTVAWVLACVPSPCHFRAKLRQHFLNVLHAVGNAVSHGRRNRRLIVCKGAPEAVP